MRTVLFTGGARSGKSRAAIERAIRVGGDDVTFLATGRAVDTEMARRIERHRAERPQAWETLEADGDAAAALARARNPVVVLDCLTFLVADALEPVGRTDGGERVPESAAGPESAATSGSLDHLTEAEDRVEAAVDRLLRTAAARDGWLLVVTNEVGDGVVPVTALGRVFRDAQGRANQRMAAVAEEVALLVCGIPVRIK